jgi:glycosyltransferase involved in cell wall biosynthesis
MPEEILVSVVIPCYNQAEYLRDCLASVLSQSYGNWEAIVVDDGSDQHNKISQIAEAIQDRRLRLVRHEQNRGLAAARNTGVKHALGGVIVPLDSDDKLASTYLETVIDGLSNKDIGFIYFDVQCFGDSNEIWRSRTFDPASVTTEHQFILGTSPFKKEIWERIGGWCEDPIFARGYEDTDFLLSAISHGFRGMHIGQALYHYRISSSSMASQPRIFVLPLYRRIYTRNKAFIDRHSSYHQWMAIGWLEVAGGYLKLRKPHLALGCGLWVWLTCVAKRSQAATLITSTLRMFKETLRRMSKVGLIRARSLLLR